MRTSVAPHASKSFENNWTFPYGSRRVPVLALARRISLAIMGTSRNEKVPSLRNERGVAKHWPVASHRIDPSLKALIERTAKRVDCSQAVALNLILTHVETGLDGLPTWVSEEYPEKEALALDNIA